jgi:hypothetical protein
MNSPLRLFSGFVTFAEASFAAQALQQPIKLVDGREIEVCACVLFSRDPRFHVILSPE